MGKRKRIALVLLTLSLLLSCQDLRLQPPLWHECHKAIAWQIYPRGSCVIYDAIESQAREIWETGGEPTAVRLNSFTRNMLFQELTFQGHKTESGTYVYSLDTAFGRLQVLVDNALGDEQAIVLRRMPRMGQRGMAERAE